MTDDPLNSLADFATTERSLLERANADGSTVRRLALDTLLRRYYPALRKHLVVRRRLLREQAEELLQGFVAAKLLEGRLLTKVDLSKGKFRWFLVRSLDNYVCDELYRPTRPVSLNEKLEPFAVESGVEADIFELAWARQVLTETLATFKADCDAKGQNRIWEVFRIRLFEPLLLGKPVPVYADLVAQLGFASAEQSANALVTAKRKFKEAFDRGVETYLAEDETPNDALMELLRVLSGAAVSDWQLASEAEPSSTEPELDASIQRTQPECVSALLEVSRIGPQQWTAEDMRDLLAHQLQMPLADLATAVPAASACRYLENNRLATVASLFADQQPPIEVLDAVKTFSRQQTRRSVDGLPTDISSAVYFACIAAAQVRLGQSITKSDNRVLEIGYRSLVGRPWLDRGLRELLTQALAGLKIDR